MAAIGTYYELGKLLTAFLAIFNVIRVICTAILTFHPLVLPIALIVGNTMKLLETEFVLFMMLKVSGFYSEIPLCFVDYIRN